MTDPFRQPFQPSVYCIGSSRFRQATTFSIIFFFGTMAGCDLRPSNRKQGHDQDRAAYLARDRQPGNKSQVGGVVEALGLDYKIKSSVIRRRWPNVARGRGLRARRGDAEIFVAPWPDLIAAAAAERHPSPGASRRRRENILCQIMYRVQAARRSSMICVPRHDGRAPPALSSTARRIA